MLIPWLVHSNDEDKASPFIETHQVAARDVLDPTKVRNGSSRPAPDFSIALSAIPRRFFSARLFP
jgi:hypothetical protein